MNIPYEAIEFVAQLSDVTDKCMGSCLADLAEELREGSPRALRAAAMIEGHARAAQVAVLREVADSIRQAKWTSQDWTGQEVAKGVSELIARGIETKAAELEAGAGQTGEVRDGR